MGDRGYIQVLKRRETDDQNDVVDAEIKRQRATPFQWATLFFTNLPMLVKVVSLLLVGAGTAVTAPKVYQSFNGEEAPPPIAPGQTVVPKQTISPELRQSLESMQAAIAELQAADKAGDAASSTADKAQNERLDRLEALVQ